MIGATPDWPLSGLQVATGLPDFHRPVRHCLAKEYLNADQSRPAVTGLAIAARCIAAKVVFDNVYQQCSEFCFIHLSLLVVFRKLFLAPKLLKGP